MDDELVGLVVAETTEKMTHAVDHVRSEFAAVRTGRASPALVEGLKVDYYGTESQLRTLAQFSVPEPRLLVVSPYDKSSIAVIEKAIVNSDLGVSPSNDGSVIRLSFPPLTEERRKDMVKVVRNKAEEGRVAIRNIRRGARHDLEGLEKDGALSKDELERVEKDLEKLTQEQVSVVDQLLSHKEHELLEV